MISYGYIMRPDSRLRLWNWNVSFKRDSQLAGVTGPRSQSPQASLTMFAGLNVNLCLPLTFLSFMPTIMGTCFTDADLEFKLGLCS